MKSESNKGQLKHLKVHELPKDKIIFWDTSFVIDTLFAPDEKRIRELKTRAKSLNERENKELHKLQFLMHRHNVAVEFVERLIKEGINIAFSSILFHELYFALKYIELDKVYKNREKSIKELKNNPKILSNYIPQIMKNWELFMELLSKFRSRIFAITPSDLDIIKETLRIRVKYGLKPNDSLHIGTILAGKKEHIVVFDKHFRDVALEEGLNVWYKV